MPVTFHAFSPSHQIVLCTCVVVLLVMAWARRKQLAFALGLERGLGTLLLLNWPVTTLSHWHLGTLDWENGLPFHFCDIAGLAGGLALWSRHRLAVEVVYFFGLAGTLQGLLTPNLKVDFPDLRFFVFFLLHGGVVITAIHVVTAMKCPPRPGAVTRMFAVTMVYAALVAVINHGLGTNYGFLCHKPEQASLMDHLGSWPWYILSLITLCVTFYSLLNLPFVLGRRLQRPQA